MNNARLVYSTQSGKICPQCERPVSDCACKKKKGPAKSPGCPNDGKVRIRREVKGRNGKTVTAVYGLALDDKELQLFAKILKQRCGAGGSIKDGAIFIQGDHRRALLDEIKKHGYAVVCAGG